jgi:hypothetical protein
VFCIVVPVSTRVHVFVCASVANFGNGSSCDVAENDNRVFAQRLTVTWRAPTLCVSLHVCMDLDGAFHLSVMFTAAT